MLEYVFLMFAFGQVTVLVFVAEAVCRDWLGHLVCSFLLFGRACHRPCGLRPRRAGSPNCKLFCPWLYVCI